MTCDFCKEELLPDERADIVKGDLHRECLLRTIIGSVAHVEKRCGCYVPGSEAGDPPKMSLRDAARLAVARFRELNQQSK